MVEEGKDFTDKKRTQELLAEKDIHVERSTLKKALLTKNVKNLVDLEDGQRIKYPLSTEEFMNGELDWRQPSDEVEQQEDLDEKNAESQSSKPLTQGEKEKLLDRQEAEAILNALKADESNMKKKKYKVSKQVKLEKDW